MPKSIAAAIASYATRFHRVVAGDGDHHVGSPLAAWLLLASAADGRPGPLDEYLGVPGDRAGEVLRVLLANPHPAVGSALAWWTAPAARSDLVQSRLARLPGEVAVGDIPTQAEADSWAAEHTAGLISRFPAALHPDVLLVMASALVTRVSWSRPFGLALAAELGPSSSWATSLGLVLRSRPEHRVSLCSSPIGLVGVHMAEADEGLVVHSVIGPPDVAAADLIAAWLTGPIGECDPMEMDLGDGHAWSLTELDGYNAGTTHADAVLPAWSAASTFDLMHPSLGFGDVLAELRAELLMPTPVVDVTQVTRAGYSRTGFEAAAVMDAIAMGATYRPGRERHLEIRFNRPFAVFATTVQPPGHSTTQSAWHGVPVFSGWITEPINATPSPGDEEWFARLESHLRRPRS